MIMRKATIRLTEPGDPFEDHCWKDIIPEDVIELYSSYRRDVGVGPSPALVAIDLYELVYQGGAKPVAEVMKAYPNSCGEYAWAAIEPTRRLFAAARAAGLPVFYSTRDPAREATGHAWLLHALARIPSRWRTTSSTCCTSAYL